MTIPAQDRVAWLKARKRGIGGSDAAAVVGMDPYRTALDVYNEKTGEQPERAPSPAMLRGRYLEDVAVELFCELTGRKVRRQPQRAHPSYPFIIGNIDRQILADGDGRGTGLLEIKCPGVRTFLRMQREGIPAHYVVQALHYLAVYDYKYMTFALFSGELWRLLHFDVARDDEFIATLVAREVDFWRERVEQRVPPPSLQAVLAPPANMPEVTSGSIVQREDPEWAEAVESYKQAVTLAETAELVEVGAKARLKELMGEFGCAEGADLRAYWRQMPGRKTFDRKALEGAKPLDGILVGAAIVEWLQDPTTSEGMLFERLKECRVDFAAFEKQGAAYEEFRAFRLKPESGEDDG